MGLIRVAVHPVVSNLLLANSNTEYSFNVGIQTRRILIRPREAETIKMSFTAGQSATQYLEIRANESFSEEEVYGEFTIYFQCTTQNVTVEILEWKQ